MLILFGSGGGRGRAHDFMPEYFISSPLHRDRDDFNMTLCETESPPPSSSFGALRLFAGCGWLWWFCAYPRPSTGPLPRLRTDISRGFRVEFGAPPFSSLSTTTGASLLLSCFVKWNIGREGVVRSIPLVRSRQLTSKISSLPSIFFAEKYSAHSLISGWIVYSLVEGSQSVTSVFPLTKDEWDRPLPPLLEPKTFALDT